ncbi:hypothetical protein OPQ81_005349 [Rhizoctonia solani]|nr:hypothetical protein OPQ81_005349 [Rhizoctonia solani]
MSDSEEKEEVWTSINWEELDTDLLKSPKIEALMIQLNAAKIDKGKASSSKVRNIKRNASKPKDLTHKLPKPIIIEAEVNGHKVHALIDSGSLGDFISTTVIDQLKLLKEMLANPVSLQMAVTGS